MKCDIQTMEEYKQFQGTYDFTYFSGHKNTPNRVTILGKNCGDRLCLAFARQGKNEVFNGTTGIVHAARRLKLERNCIDLPLNGSDNENLLDVFRSYASKLASWIAQDSNYKVKIKDGTFKELVNS